MNVPGIILGILIIVALEIYTRWLWKTRSHRNDPMPPGGWDDR